MRDLQKQPLHPVLLGREASAPDAGAEQKLLLKVDDFDIRSKFKRQVNVSLPVKGLMDGTLYALVFLHRAGVPISQDPMEVHHAVQLTDHMLGKPASQAGESDAAQSVSLWRPRLVLRVMSEDIPLDAAATPTDLRRYLRTYQSGKKMLYLPLLFINELANRVQDMMEIKSITLEVPLSISYEDISLWKLRLWIRIQDAVNTLRQLGFSERDLDEIKNIFVEPNLSYLALAGLVASVHFLSDIVALKNDIGLWKKERNRAGVSNPAALRECFCGLVVLLSMLDDRQTSPLVLLPAAASFAIEIWKALGVWFWSRRRRPAPRHRKQDASDTRNNEQDPQAMKGLSYVLYLLCFGASLYPLLCMKVRSLYSWLISSLANGVYTAGFLSMLPQLVVNYELKSVARVSQKALVRNVFRSSINGAFAIIISMPTGHRLACFRDSAVLLIYLYQRWIYPADRTRRGAFRGLLYERPEPKLHRD
ncbi:cleft lip and palate transmembrane protein 1-like protein isoform X2 [Brienomyrus brachyistius]|uniref:cleft lip and palate transmembrane protein 1-like protein isoform X2 n=1 Tax=Brienomyrus brachyistius TaxID=42636 RepID=UPI0020B29084|nr:cleft lip and palate transmembrane protein 1-like protein isoform X2 [Brienomyrus brachyistius]